MRTTACLNQAFQYQRCPRAVAYEHDIPKARGRHFFANPGPTHIRRSRTACHGSPWIDFNDVHFATVYEEALAGLKRVLRTDQHLFMCNRKYGPRSTNSAIPRCFRSTALFRSATRRL